MSEQAANKTLRPGRYPVSGAGLGLRSKRFAMIVDDGTVSFLAVEEGTGLDVSSAEKILEAL